MRRVLQKVLSDDPLIRAMSYQSVLSAFGEGAFLTGSAFYFTQVVGLSAAQVGLGLTIGGLAVFAGSVPLGRLADRVGTRRTWILGSALEALLFASWVLVDGFVGFLAVTVALDLAATWARAGRNAYRFEVFPRETRVRSLAYMRASRNVGYTLGAGAGGMALAAPGDGPIMAIPVVTAVILAANAAWVARLPRLSREAETEASTDSPLEGALEAVSGRRRRDPRAALRNRGFLVMSTLDGVLSTHQVLLNVVIPLWLVQETDAPRELLALLFGTNTVMAVALQVAAARGVADVTSSLRAQRRGAFFFVLSCAIVMVTHDTVGWVTIALVWLGHVTVTGAELYQSAGQWGLQAELSDPDRRGEYQGVAGLGYTMGTVWAPAAFTFLAMEVGTLGWLTIAALVVLSALGLTPAARAAERHLARVAPASGASTGVASG